VTDPIDTSRPADPYRGTKLTNQAAYDEIRAILASLSDESDRQLVLMALLTNRCRKCLDYDPQGNFWCCYDSRGG
jgi:hypothetical protein